jgi:iron complex outermembrane recepter protein
MAHQKKVETNRRLQAGIALALAAGLLGSAATHAQDAAGAREADPDEIIVTATKRSERLLDVPISMTTFGEQQLEQLRPENLEDLTNYVPNMFLAPASESQTQYITLRGLDGGVARSSGRSVGIYIDGAYTSADNLANLPVADIERLEVLKGPQGTLFGRDTIGGAINVTTRAPGKELAGRVELEAGNFGRRVITAGVDVPLAGEQLALRVSARKLDTDGYITNLFDGRKADSKDQLFGRVQLFWTPSESFDARLVYSRVDRDDSPTTGENQRGTFSDQVPYQVNLNRREEFRQKGNALALSMNWTLGDGYTLTSITGWSDTKDSSLVDRDLTPAEVSVQTIRYEVRDVSQELRLSSPTGGRFDYIVGLYYLDSETHNEDSYPVFGAAWLANVGFPPILPDVTDGQVRDFTTKSASVFGNANFHLTDQWTVFGGLRYTSDKKDITYSAFGEIYGAFGFNATGLSTRTKDTPLSWSAGVRYKPMDTLSTYLSVARGYRSASIKDDFITAADRAVPGGFVTKPEFVTSYELGAKFRSEDRRVSANAAVFFTDYTDIQVGVSLPPLLFVRQLVNAAEAHIQGVELDGSVALTPNLRLSAAVGYLKTEYDEFRPDPATDLSGSGFGNAPEWTSSAALDYERQLGDAGDLLFHLDYANVSGPGDFVSNPAFDVVGGYSLLNGSIGFRSQGGRWSASLWGRNLLDHDSPTSSTLWGAGLGLNQHNVYTYQAPRSYGISVRFDF